MKNLRPREVIGFTQVNQLFSGKIRKIFLLGSSHKPGSALVTFNVLQFLNKHLSPPLLSLIQEPMVPSWAGRVPALKGRQTRKTTDHTHINR